MELIDEIEKRKIIRVKQYNTTKNNIKVITAGNCMMCGREIKIVTNKENYKVPNILFCPRCEEKRMRELNKRMEKLESQLNMSVQNIIEEEKK